MMQEFYWEFRYIDNNGNKRIGYIQALGMEQAKQRFFAETFVNESNLFVAPMQHKGIPMAIYLINILDKERLECARKYREYQKRIEEGEDYGLFSVNQGVLMERIEYLDQLKGKVQFMDIGE
jgi:hypothetical protein